MHVWGHSRLTIVRLHRCYPRPFEVGSPILSFNEQPAGGQRKGQITAEQCEGQREYDTKHSSMTDLTSVLPSSAIPLQPSRPLVQALRSPGLRLSLLQPASVIVPSSPPVTPAQRSFSHSCTSLSSDRQCLSSRWSLSTSRVNRTRARFICGPMICVVSGNKVKRVKGWVKKNGRRPRMRKVMRRGISWTMGMSNSEEKATTVKINGV